jgi:hypothetical protein
MPRDPDEFVHIQIAAGHHHGFAGIVARGCEIGPARHGWWLGQNRQGRGKTQSCT